MSRVLTPILSSGHITITPNTHSTLTNHHDYDAPTNNTLQLCYNFLNTLFRILIHKPTYPNEIIPIHASGDDGIEGDKAQKVKKVDYR
ncbi:hypothetical protein EON63_02740 [archaeon]|nr:MAG: hypothetical protein EON63_02740 [archaeon]